MSNARIGLSLPLDGFALDECVTLAQDAEARGSTDIWTREISSVDAFSLLAAVATAGAPGDGVRVTPWRLRRLVLPWFGKLDGSHRRALDGISIDPADRSCSRDGGSGSTGTIREQGQRGQSPRPYAGFSAHSPRGRADSDLRGCPRSAPVPPRLVHRPRGSAQHSTDQRAECRAAQKVARIMHTGRHAHRRQHSANQQHCLT